VFSALDAAWGPHTIYRFATRDSCQALQPPHSGRSCALFFHPDAVWTDAFSALWAGEVNWVFPPVPFVGEAITALRASLPPAADAPRETRPEREALATALHDFDIGSFVGLSAPFLLPECQPAAWANARCNRPFPEGLLRGDASCRHRASIKIKTVTDKTVTLRFEESGVAPLRPGESIWSRIYVWEIAHLLHDREGHPPDVMQFIFDDAGTWRTLHPLLSLEACGVFGAAVTLHVTQETREWPGWNLDTPGISDADAYAGLSRIGGHCIPTFGLSQRRYHPDL
jgi:hypothetical protein